MAVTWAPALRPSWTAAVPTPPAAPWTSRRSPARRPDCVKTASWAVVKTSGTPPACVPVQAVGHGHGLALVDGRELGLPAAADDRHDPVADREALGARPEGGDLAGQLEPRDVRVRALGRGVHALALQQVGAVEAGGPDADQDLARAGLGIGVVLDDDLSVADGGGAHGRAV